MAAVTHGADAIHPGYGFLAENAAFSRLCADNDITFIGPGPESIELMGDKAMARATMMAAGVPVTPGSDGVIGDIAQAEEPARGGALLKAVSGREAPRRSCHGPGQMVASRYPPPRTVRRTLVLGVSLAALILLQNLAVYRGAVLPQVRSFSAGLQGSLVPWGRWLREHTPERSEIATPDIGALEHSVTNSSTLTPWRASSAAISRTIPGRSWPTSSKFIRARTLAQ